MPDLQRTVARTTAAALAAAGVAATMVLAGTGAVTMAVTVVVTVVLVAVQALLLRGPGGARRTRRALLAGSAQAGLTYPLAGDPGVASALVYVGVGVVFGVVVVVALGLVDRVDVQDPVPGPGDEPRVDTRPLPVVDGD